MKSKWLRQAKEDLLNKRFGNLIVKQVLFEKHKAMGYTCVCLCDYGKIKTTGKRLLIRKQVKSCGCLNKGPRKSLRV